MTIQEIEEFVVNELSDLNLSTKEKEKIVAFIKNQDNYYMNHKNPYIRAHNKFLEKLEDCIEIFRRQGFDYKESMELAKNAVLEHNRRDFKEKLAFLRAINLEESVILNDTLSLRFNLEKAHAKKMYLVATNNPNLQKLHRIIHENDSNFEKKFNLQMKDILKQYSLNQETIDVWMIISNMNDEKFQNYFGITREELSYIYPTTKDELATIHYISTLSDEEIIKRYGLTRIELLQKYPLNNDTLNALRSIRQASDKAIENTFHQTRQEILKLRTISTEMIKIAQRERLVLKRKIYTKEELSEMLKAKKKGTYPNG